MSLPPSQPSSGDTARFSAGERVARGSLELRGRLLVADDDAMSREVLARRLQSLGHEVVLAADGREAMKCLEAGAFDLVLLDVTMPGMDGREVLRAMKASEAWRELPVILIAGLHDLDSIATCIELGADDYLAKPFKPVLLQARLHACLEKKRLRDQERATYDALVESQRHLAAELAEAAAYVTSLLPAPLAGDIRSEWRFIPSTQLGGDSFGYHWLDGEHLAMFLLDVCGHGVGAALLSISVMNVLRSQSLPNTDFKDPGAVLVGLNEAFQMERQNNMYFTIWYGVYHKGRRQIAYARGGHPPAVLLTGDSPETARRVELKTPGLVIGSLPGMDYPTAVQDLGPFARLFLFSDGVYEVADAGGKMWDYQEFLTLLSAPPGDGRSELDAVMARARAFQGADAFEDDFSIVKIEV